MTFQFLSGYILSSAFCWCLVSFQLIDNVPILQIDMVWCYFMLRDIRWLSVAGARLEKAREGIERAHGKDSSRVRLLQAGRHPELAMWVFICMFLFCIFLAGRWIFLDMLCEANLFWIPVYRHLRLELLEGVVAYHSGQFDKSRNALTTAQAKYFQVSWIPNMFWGILTFKTRDREMLKKKWSYQTGWVQNSLLCPPGFLWSPRFHQWICNKSFWNVLCTSNLPYACYL